MTSKLEDEEMGKFQAHLQSIDGGQRSERDAVRTRAVLQNMLRDNKEREANPVSKLIDPDFLK